MRTNSKKKSDSEGKIKDFSDSVDRVHLEKGPFDPAGIAPWKRTWFYFLYTQRDAFLIRMEEYRLRKDISDSSRRMHSQQNLLILPGEYISRGHLSRCLRRVQLNKGPFWFHQGSTLQSSTLLIMLGEHVSKKEWGVKGGKNSKATHFDS